MIGALISGARWGCGNQCLPSSLGYLDSLGDPLRVCYPGAVPLTKLHTAEVVGRILGPPAGRGAKGSERPLPTRAAGRSSPWPGPRAWTAASRSRRAAATRVSGTGVAGADPRAAVRARRHPGRHRHLAGRRPAADGAAVGRSAAPARWCWTAACARRCRSRLLSDAGAARCASPVPRRPTPGGRAQLEARGAEVLCLPAWTNGWVDLDELLQNLYAAGRARADGRGRGQGADQLPARLAGRLRGGDRGPGAAGRSGRGRGAGARAPAPAARAWPPTGWATTGCWTEPCAGAGREPPGPDLHRPGPGGGHGRHTRFAWSGTAAGAHPGFGDQRRDRAVRLPRATAADLALDETLPALAKGSFRYPFRYGYASVGQVVGAGDDREQGWIGRRVFSFQPHASAFWPDRMRCSPSPTVSTGSWPRCSPARRRRSTWCWTADRCWASGWWWWGRGWWAC